MHRRHLLGLCVAAAVLLLVATAALGATGTLRTTERGDVRYLDAERLGDGTEVRAGADEPGFVVESPTDADAFYNAVVRVRNGGPMLNPDSTAAIQPFHYHPLTYYLFLALAVAGYVPFKFALLAVSLLAAMAGTALLLVAERPHVDVAVSNRAVAGLAVASCGVGPMLSNFKTGQVTPIMYCFVACCWWAYRSDRLGTAGGALTAAALFKPYAVAPVALGFRRDRLRLALSTLGTYLAATLVVAAVFGVDTVRTYVDVILVELGAQAGGTVAPISSPSNLQLYAWLGPAATPVRALAFLPLAYVGLVYLWDAADEYARPTFGATLVSVFVVTTGASGIDLPLLLPVVVLVGLHAYADADRFWPVALAFLLLHAHPTTLELLIGAGARYVGVVGANQDAIRAVLPVLQPGLYAVAGVYLLVLDDARPLPDPVTFARRVYGDLSPSR
jgi:hypothetical protein